MKKLLLMLLATSVSLLGSSIIVNENGENGPGIYKVSDDGSEYTLIESIDFQFSQVVTIVENGNDKIYFKRSTAPVADPSRPGNFLSFPYYVKYDSVTKSFSGEYTKGLFETFNQMGYDLTFDELENGLVFSAIASSPGVSAVKIINTDLKSSDIDGNLNQSSFGAVAPVAPGGIIALGSEGASNTSYGTNALSSVTTGTSNTAMGVDALKQNTTGSGNTATGKNTLLSNTSGNDNTALGSNALTANLSGKENTATGSNALASNTTGEKNTASGAFALFSNTTGRNNTALGQGALFKNTSGSFNHASGYDALNANTTGSYNSASGSQSLSQNTTGENNTASGYTALSRNTTGNYNTATGSEALLVNTTGSS